MASPPYSPELVQLLIALTQQPLTAKDVNSSLVFVTALAIVLVGVIHADTQIQEEEKLRLLSTLSQFMPPGDDFRLLVRNILESAAKAQVFRKVDQLTPLVDALSDTERLLIIDLAYDMSGADGNVDAREQDYIEALIQKFEVE